MDSRRDILQLLRQVADGSATPEEALVYLKREPFEDLGYAKVDLHRGVRQGAAEVIYGAGKTPEQIAGIAAAMEKRGSRNILITRIGPEAAELVGRAVPLEYYPIPKLAIACPGERGAVGHVVVTTGGTSDMAVAEEAALTAEVMGNRVTRLYDVGVAGIHRLLAHEDLGGRIASAVVQFGPVDECAVCGGGSRNGGGTGFCGRRAGGLSRDRSAH